MFINCSPTPLTEMDVKGQNPLKIRLWRTKRNFPLKKRKQKTLSPLIRAPKPSPFPRHPVPESSNLLAGEKRGISRCVYIERIRHFIGNRSIKSCVYTVRFDLTFGAVSMHGGDKARLGMGLYCPLAVPHPSVRRSHGVRRVGGL